MKIWLALLLSIILTTSAAAQEDAKPASESAADSASSGDFDALFSRWKEIIGELRVLQAKTVNASAADKVGMEKQYQTLRDEGRELIPKLEQSALEAFVAAPNQDRNITEFLLSLISRYYQHDQYEQLLALAEKLIAAGIDFPGVMSVAGVAAFYSSQFERAEELLRQAKEKKVLDPATIKGLKLQTEEQLWPLLEQYQKLWAEESAAREKDQQANLPRVMLKTSEGDIVVELFEDHAPNTVANFISLVEKGYYDGTPFHRVLPQFMAQGGEREEGPGYMIPDEVDRKDFRKHFRGSLSMAKMAAPNTAGSQFFLNFVPTPHLDGIHTVFGRVIEGIEVLGKLQRIDPENPSPIQPDKIIEAKVLRKRDHEYVPKKVGE